MANENDIVERLFSSFSDLEKAITNARLTLEAKEEVPEEILERLSSYDGILLKQRKLASDLCNYIADEEWDEVNRCVGLINGLSSMIRDDAKAILSSLALNSDSESDTDVNYC